ncbi:MAG: hypothetical protein AAGI69_12685 [Cyanobacteria bacterium P01_H01_bin.21]
MATAKGWPFSKPSGPVLGLRVERLSSAFKQLDIRQTLTHQPYRFGVELEQPSQLLIKISSTIAVKKRWYRAGYLAHILRGTPISDPIASTQRVYFGQQYISFEWTGFAYYLEFWPHSWISDYRLELWAREGITTLPTTPISPKTGLLSFQVGESISSQFTFFGESILFP